VIIGGVAKRYAQALFEIGLEEKNYNELLGELEDFCSFISEKEDVRNVIASSVYNIQEKMRLLDSILSEKKYSETTVKFLKLIMEKGRIVFIDQILNGFRDLVERHEGIERVEITVPSPLDDAQREEILDALCEKTGKKVVLEERVDPSIIGGLIIKAGSTIYDGSVRTQIDRLSENLKKG
jgi:F-type H+-transporting ATPase subunit delta